MAKEFTSVAKAAFDTSAHLIAGPDMNFHRFMMAFVKDCEGLVATINQVKVDQSTDQSGISRVSQDASSAGTIAGFRAESLADWARVHRYCSVAIAKELAQLSGAALDHSKLGNLTNVADHAFYLLTDGTRELTANWDAGTWKIRAWFFQSDIATGTAPFLVASTTVVTNLNADRVDGLHATAFVKGPFSSTDNAIARFQLTTGQFLEDSKALLDDSGNITAAGANQRIRAYGVAEVASSAPTAVIGMFWINTAESPAAPTRGPINVITADTTIDVTYDWIRVDPTSGPVAITLPLASVLPGKPFDITNIGTGVVTVKAAGSDTINGDATQIIDSKYNSMTIVSDGSNWGIL